MLCQTVGARCFPFFRCNTSIFQGVFSRYASIRPNRITVCNIVTKFRISPNVSNWISTTTNQAEALIQPLRPGSQHDLQATYTFRPGVQPTGIDLIGSFASNIYRLWKFVADERIEHPVQTREQPFSNLRWTFLPSLRVGAVLTTMKVGIIATLAMREVQLQSSWPGHTLIEIKELSQQVVPPTVIGYMIIRNYDESSFISASNAKVSDGSPSTFTRPNETLHRQPSATARAMIDPEHTADSSNGTSTTARINALPLRLERRWLDCYTNFFLVIMSKAFSDKMGDDPEYRVPDRGINIVGAECGNADPQLPPRSRDNFHMAIYGRDRIKDQPPLTWDRLAVAMLDWIDQVRGDTPWYLGYIIDSEEGPLVGINIKVGD